MSTYLGILVDQIIFQKIRKQIDTRERLAFYEEACEQYSLIPCFFRINDIQVGKNQVSALIKGKNNVYSLQKINKPRVIHNRGFYRKRRDLEKIKLLQKEGV